LLLPVGAAVSGLVAGWLVPFGAPGIGLVLAAWLCAATVAAVGWRKADRLDRVLGAVSVLLASVAAVRASEWLVALCVAGALGLAAVVTVRARRWPALLLALPALGIGALRSIPWLARPAARMRGGKHVVAWIRGLAVGLIAVWLVGALLVSADDAFAKVIDVVIPNLTLDELFGRVVLGVATAGLVVGGGFSLLAPPRWELLPEVPVKPRSAVEWLVPVALVDALLGLFFAVQATVLFGGDTVVRQLGVSYADRARQGFGQLVAVTLLVGLLLAWAATRVVRARRRQHLGFAVSGGVLVALTLLLVGSALRRLWLYEAAYGWTLLRLLVGCFEIWLGLVLLGAALAWALNRTSVLPRGLALAAGLGLLTLAVIGPDSLVAAGNIYRLEHGNELDTSYLLELSADAVPQLDGLPEPYRSDVLEQFTEDRVGDDAWSSWNLGRWRAAQTLEN
jgi:hypothetical protein